MELTNKFFNKDTHTSLHKKDFLKKRDGQKKFPVSTSGLETQFSSLFLSVYSIKGSLSLFWTNFLF